MSRALRELGLGPDADERAIKRAYAAKLRTTRPDSDPKGFQALNEAYQAALAWARSRGNAAHMGPSTATAKDDIEEDIAMEPVGTATRVQSADALFPMLGAQHETPDEAEQNTATAIDAPDREPVFAGASVDDEVGDEHALASAQAGAAEDTIRFDLDAFFEHCTALAVHSRADELLAWLNAQPMLWSLEHKSQIGHWLLRYLHEQRPPIEARRFDVIADFFGVLELNSSYDAYVIHRLRHRLHLAWEVRTGQWRALAERTGMDGSSIAADIRQTRRMLAQIRRPMRTAQALFAGLVPAYPSAVRRFVHRLDFGDLDDLPPPIDPQQVAFWDAAGNRSRFSAPRLMIGAARCFAYALVGVAIVLLVKAMTPGAVVDPTIALKTGATLLAALLAGWSTWIGGQACLDWQCLPENEDVRLRRVRWALIPSLAALAVALDWMTHWDTAATAASMTAFLLAWHRYRRRNGPLFGFAPRAPIALAIGMACLFGVVVALLDRAPHALVGGICALAVTLWWADLRKQRVATES